ncbi:MAG: hypothetical protein ACOY33_11330 [Pseudomonadota bacterium]
MKHRFGNFLTRLLWGGTVLSPVEARLFEACMSALPDHLRTVVEAQVASCNLLQREIDGRALNFYRKGRSATDTPKLKMLVTEAPLIRISARVYGLKEPVHALLVAVNGRLFCMSLSRAVNSLGAGSGVRVEKVSQAWRSNFSLPGTPERSSEADGPEG